MRRYLALAALGIAALWAAWTGGRLAGPVPVAAAVDSSTAKPGLGLSVAGGWMLYFYESETPVEVLVALAGDGAMIINDTTRPDGLFNCTGIGSWKAIAPKTMASTLIVFCRDFQQNLMFYEKSCTTLTLGKDGNWMEGESVLYFYLPGQNPLDPEEIPVFEMSVPSAAARIIVE